MVADLSAGLGCTAYLLDLVVLEIFDCGSKLLDHAYARKNNMWILD